MFSKLAAVGIKVTDFSKAFAFYTEVLELPVHIEDKDNQFAELVVGDSLLALLSEATLKDMSENLKFIDPDRSTFLFAVEVENLEETYDLLLKKGVTFIQEPKSTPWGQKVAYFKDIEGYVWEISEPFSE
jgi:lactoylglutathione lyase